MTINHPFFNNSYVDVEDIELDQTKSNPSVDIPYPILSLATIRNSDFISTGSCDGNLNFYRYTKPVANKTNPSLSVKEKVELFKQLPMNNRGCINAMKVNKTNEFMVLGYGKDSRLGRWDTIDKSKNGISIVKLFD